MNQSFLFPDPTRKLSRAEAFAGFATLKANVAKMNFAADEKPKPKKNETATHNIHR